MKFSSVPILFSGLLLFFILITHRLVRSGHLEMVRARQIYLIVFLLALWGIASAWMAISGFYLSPSLLKLLPGLWLPVVPIAIILIFFYTSPAFRNTLTIIADETPLYWFVYIEALRVASIGTLFKTIRGEFPLFFELGVGITDLLFGLSAFYVARLIKSNRIGWHRFAIWNIIGAGIIIFPAGILMQMGLPGPLHVFNGSPSGEALLIYPMALAPTAVVPIFILINLWLAWRLFNARPARLLKNNMAHEQVFTKTIVCQ